MTDTRALYSVIQYLPDLARAEGVNVGVAIVCPARERVVVRMSTNSERAKKFFGARNVDALRLPLMLRSLERRLSQIAPTEEAFQRFIAAQGNNLIVLPPQALAVSDVETAIANLFAVLVGERKPIHRDRAPKGPDLDSYFAPLFAKNIPMMRNVTVEIPTLGKTLKAPLAFLNGAVNYIKPEGFGTREHRAVEMAKSIGADGHVLAKHPDPIRGLPRKLIVAAKLKEPAMEQILSSVFQEFGVRMVPESRLPAFVNEVAQHAHG